MQASERSQNNKQEAAKRTHNLELLARLWTVKRRGHQASSISSIGKSERGSVVMVTEGGIKPSLISNLGKSVWEKLNGNRRGHQALPYLKHR